MDGQRPCKGMNRTGGPCGAPAVHGGDWCIWHSPDLQAQRAEWNRKGGKGRSTASRVRKMVPETLLDVEAMLRRTMAAVEAGEMEPAVLNALSNGARAFAALYEAGILLSRVDRLETVLVEEESA